MTTTELKAKLAKIGIIIAKTPSGNDSGPPPIEAMLTRFDPDQIKYNKHFDNIFYIGYLKR